MLPEEPPEITIPKTAPVMVLEQATLFPNCLMPLFVFEPRFRLMLNHALETDRLLCIGTVRPDSPVDAEVEDVHATSTAALVRACVTHDDGTSHIVLQGIQRVTFNAWPQIKPFRIAEISPLDVEDDAVYQNPAKQLASDLIDLTAKATGEDGKINPMLHEHLRGISDPGAIADVVAHLVIHDPEQRQEMLECTSPIERLHELIQLLQKAIAGQSG